MFNESVELLQRFLVRVILGGDLDLIARLVRRNAEGTEYEGSVALHCTYMFVLTCSFAVRSVCFRTSPANALLHISLEIRLEHSYHCTVRLEF